MLWGVIGHLFKRVRAFNRGACAGVQARGICRPDFLFALSLALAVAGFPDVFFHDGIKRWISLDPDRIQFRARDAFVEIYRDTFPQALDFPATLANFQPGNYFHVGGIFVGFFGVSFSWRAFPFSGASS